MQQVYQSVYTLFLLLREEVLGKDIIAQNSENSETTLDEDKLHLFAKQNKLKLQFSKEKFSAKKLQKKAPFIFIKPQQFQTTI